MPNYDTPIAERFLFPVYNTRELYQAATGKEPPPFNAAMKPKYWFDPAAASAPRDEVREYLVVTMRDGKPVARHMELDAVDAANVNIPGVADQILDATGQVVMLRAKVPEPINPLLPGEELVLMPFGGIVARNMPAYQAALNDVDQFTKGDRAMLRRIAEKLGA